jgi:hypothetical protein
VTVGVWLIVVPLLTLKTLAPFIISILSPYDVVDVTNLVCAGGVARLVVGRLTVLSIRRDS